MKQNVRNESFRLSRYFSITSLVGICVVVAVLSIFYRHIAVSAMVEHETRADVNLAQAMANTIWPKYAAFVQNASRLPTEELPHREEIAQIRRDVLQQMKGLNVVKVKIYNVDGLTVFSTDPTQIGDDKSQNPGFLSARAGTVKSELTFREQFSAFEEVIVDRNVLSPYIPIRKDESSPVEGVFEIYSDVTELVDYLEKTQWRIVSGVLLSLLVLYAFLFLMVRRADRIIKAQEADLHVHLENLDDANKRISAANDELEDRVEQRTAEVRAALEKAQAANIAKSQFLANMSHEIRTPINGVLGNTELLLNSDLNHKQRRTAETVLQSGESLLSVINNILDFSKIEAGKLELQSSAFDLRSLVEDLGTLFAEPAHRKGLELLCDIPLTIPTDLRGDLGRLRQILINLIGNATKFTDDGEVLVRVSSIAESDECTTLHFEVTDTGPGIARDAQDTIFESFTQVDGSMARQYGGSGLGLTISKQLVELMGGAIGIVSAPGQGSTFWFTVSLGREGGNNTDKPDGVAALQGAKVLIVDDNKSNREILQQRLDAWGMEPQCAKRGVEALETLRSAAMRESPFELVVLDKQIPGMDGLALAQAIRADSMISSVHLLMLCSVYDEFDAEVREKVNIGSYLTKPVRSLELFKCLVSSISGIRDVAQPLSATTNAPTCTELKCEARVLVVDDNLINQGITQDMLQGWGCRVDVAENGHAALERLSSATYDLILMDCQMPVMDGFEATGEIRRRERASSSDARIPIVALTANAMEGDRQCCLAAGMDDYLSKPFKQRDLGAVLQRWAGAVGSALDGDAVEPTGEEKSGTAELSNVLDQESLDNIRSLQREGAPNPLIRYIDIFLRNSPSFMDTMREAIEVNDPGRLVHPAHSLKSDSANLGAEALSTNCKRLEEMGRTQCMDGAAVVLSELERHYTDACAALRHESEKAA